MIIHNIHDNKPSRAFELLKSEFIKITDKNSKENYNPRYAAIPGNIFYDLRNGRYKEGKGNYYVIEINGEYVCSAGWHRYDNSIALLLTRTYVKPQYRAQYYAGKHILPLLINESDDYQRRWITCNEHNKTIYNMFVRLSRAKTLAPSQWPELYKTFKPIGEHKVYHVNQWVGEYNDTTL
jgi:hypothetical protein